MQQYFELVDWQGLKLLSAERRQQDSLKSFEHSVEVWKDWIRLKKELATLREELPPAELLPAKRKKQSPDPAKRDQVWDRHLESRKNPDRLKRSIHVDRIGVHSTFVYIYMLGCGL